MKTLFIYSIDNSRGEIYVGVTSDVQRTMDEDRVSSILHEDARKYLGSDQTDEWIIRVHEIFDGVISSKDSNRKLDHWRDLMRSENSVVVEEESRVFPIEFTITGNGVIS